MSLEKDINQRQFRNEYQKVSINILYTCNWMTEQVNVIFDKAGITGQQFNILRILRGSETPLSTLQIRERMLDKMSDTSRIVDRLVAKGLVKKVVSKKDKRLVDITISAKGRKVLEKLDKEQETMDSIVAAISPAEAKTMNKLLDKIRRSN